MKNLILIIFLFCFVGLQGQIVYKNDTLQKQKATIVTKEGVITQNYYLLDKDTAWIMDAKFRSIETIETKEAFFAGIEQTIKTSKNAKEQKAKANKEAFKALRLKYYKKYPKVVEITP